MDDYMPETDEIRHHYLCCWADEFRVEYEVRFNRWFAEVIRAAKCDGWAEGFDEAMDDIGASVESGLNPYGKE